MAQNRPRLSGDEQLQSADAPDASIEATQIPLAGERFAALAGKSIFKTLKEQCRYKSASFVRPAEVQSLGTGEAGHDEGPAVGQAKAIIADLDRHQRRKGLPASLELLGELVYSLNNVSGVVARVRPVSAETAFIPLTKQTRFVQWSYLKFKARRWREVAIVDIFSGGRAGSFVEFELRPGEKRAAALLLSPTDVALSDSLMSGILKQLARVRGVWGNIPEEELRGVCLKRYNHTKSSVESLADTLLRDLRSSFPPRSTFPVPFKQ